MDNPIVLRAAGAILLLCTAIASPSQTLTTLLNFDGTDGARPATMALVQGFNGNYYGTTSEGGVNTYGTVFETTPAGVPTTLHNFNGHDDNGPYAGLVLATDGNFYGTTYQGGAHNNGTVFRITQEGELTTLHSFDALDGANPNTALAQGPDEILYGTTSKEGANGYGTVFSVTQLGAFKTLHNFDASDGGYPTGLVALHDGMLAGTALGKGYGKIFVITPQGTLTTLHSFQGSDGAYPGQLALANDGKLCGTTSSGGASGNGTVFEIATDGALTTLYNFQGYEGGASALIQATDGSFYGAGLSGGNGGGGTLFRVTPSGAFKRLASFGTGSAPGEYPDGGVFQGTNGNLYGSTYEGAQFSDGTLFRFTLQTGAFVRLSPASGAAGTTIQVLGTDLTGASGVSFNGQAATFAVVSATQISTTVPAGASTGKLQVTTPAGPLVSDVAFRVGP